MDFQTKLLTIIGSSDKTATAKKIGITLNTLLNKLKNPGQWRYDEILKIEKIYKDEFETEKNI